MTTTRPASRRARDEAAPLPRPASTSAAGAITPTPSGRLAPRSAGTSQRATSPAAARECRSLSARCHAPAHAKMRTIRPGVHAASSSRPAGPSPNPGQPAKAKEWPRRPIAPTGLREPGRVQGEPERNREEDCKPPFLAPGEQREEREQETERREREERAPGPREGSGASRPASRERGTSAPATEDGQNQRGGKRPAIKAPGSGESDGRDRDEQPRKRSEPPHRRTGRQECRDSPGRDPQPPENPPESASCWRIQPPRSSPSAPPAIRTAAKETFSAIARGSVTTRFPRDSPPPPGIWIPWSASEPRTQGPAASGSGGEGSRTRTATRTAAIASRSFIRNPLRSSRTF